MLHSPSIQEQDAAFQRYAKARRKVDETLSFDDAKAAVEAWIGFLNVYLPEEKRMPEKKTTGGNVERFPVHKTRP
ncbi:hypothetical protein [Agrobacterium cavarae]|uniref:hypothetical protein n=1 Tax=Agrobacterium cavarae TaxID=2528239 RepID=UPI00289697C9|nr:hypothetical protein [Agrobacterium cavarae]